MSQAALLATATAGKEAADWREAVRWLAEVEQEAREAEEEARAAVDLVESGDWGRALKHARRACAIEARYHGRLVWQPLTDTIEAALTTIHQKD